MGKQTAFRMTKKDVIFFLNKIPEDFKILKIENIDKSWVLKELSDSEKENMNGKYFIWNTGFPIKDMYLDNSSEVHKLPLIEFYCCTEATPPSGRIYWNTYDQSQYDGEKFSKWYNKCVRILRKNAAFSYGKAIKRFVYADASEKYKDLIRNEILKEAPHFEGNIDDYFVKPEGYKNILLFNQKKRCFNRCPDCRESESAATENVNVYIEAFNSVDTSGIEYLFVGVGFDPLAARCMGLCEYIKKNTKIKVIFITNGLTDAIVSTGGDICSVFSIGDIYGADEIYVFTPAQTPEEYYSKTNSRYGEKAYERVTEFLKILNRYKKNLEKHGIQKFILPDCTRNDVYKFLCDKYGAQ